MLESPTAIQHGRAHRRGCFEEHLARIAIRVAGPVGSGVNDCVLFVDKISVTVGENGVWPRFKQAYARFQNIGQPQIIGPEIGEIVSTTALKSFVQTRAQTAIFPRYEFTGKTTV